MVSPLSDVCAIIKLSRYSGVVIRLVLVTLGLWWDLDRVSSQEYWDCRVGYLQLLLILSQLFTITSFTTREWG